MNILSSRARGGEGQLTPQNLCYVVRLRDHEAVLDTMHCFSIACSASLFHRKIGYVPVALRMLDYQIPATR